MNRKRRGWRFWLYSTFAFLLGLMAVQALFPPGEDPEVDWISVPSALWAIIVITLIVLARREWRGRDDDAA